MIQNQSMVIWKSLVSQDIVIHIVWVVLILVPPVLVTALINYEVDSAELITQLDSRMENENSRFYHREILEDLQTKGTHTLRYFSSRPHLWTLLGSYGLWDPEEVKTLYLGSSLGMPVDSKMVEEASTPVRFLNAALTSTTVRDYLVVFELLKKQGLKPGRVIVEINSWTLVRDQDALHYQLKLFGNEILRDLNLIDESNENILLREETSKWDKSKLLFSPSYLQLNLEFAFRNMYQNLWLSPAENDSGKSLNIKELPPKDQATLFPDLSLRWSDEKKARSAEEVQQIVEMKSNINKNNRGEIIPLEYNILPLHPKRLREFHMLLNLIKATGAKVEILFLPPHPLFFEQQKKIVEETGGSFTFGNTYEYVMKVAKEKRILVRGKYFPKDDTSHYMDNYHQSYLGIKDDFKVIQYSPED